MSHQHARGVEGRCSGCGLTLRQIIEANVAEAMKKTGSSREEALGTMLSVLDEAQGKKPS